jgi:ABC-type branched-subunit amino acid transport system substrate-binding protein
MQRSSLNVFIGLSLLGLVVGQRPSLAATMAEAEQSALAIGRTVGAAASCPDIARPRIKAISDQFVSAMGKVATNPRDANAVHDAYDQGVSFGQRAIETHQTDCATAGRDLANLERTPLTLVTADATPAPAPAPAPAPPPAPVQAPAATPAPAPPAPVVAVHGVTDQEIRFGMVAPFTGSAKSGGLQLRTGIQTGFNVINDAGGINGRKLKLITADDGFDATRTLAATKKLYEQDQVFAFISNFGSITSAAALPYVLQHRILFYAPFVAAPLVRREPPDRYVFTYRPSAAQETTAVTLYLMKIRRLRPEQIAVFAQGDLFGDYGYDGVLRAIRQFRPNADVPTILHMTYTSGPTVDVSDAVSQLQQYQRTHASNPIKAIVMMSQPLPAAKFIEKTHDSIPGLIYTNASDVVGNTLAEQLMLLGPAYANGVIVTEAVPEPSGYSTLSLEFAAALKKYFPDEEPSYTSLEGYLTTRILAEALRKAGPQLDTEKVVDALESLHDLELGVGAPIGFSRTDHQAIHKLWGTQLDATGHYQPFDLE